MRYFQITDTYITDSIDYAHGTYVQFIGEVPVDIMNQCYQLINGNIVLDETKYQEFLDAQAAFLAEMDNL